MEAKGQVLRTLSKIEHAQHAQHAQQHLSCVGSSNLPWAGAIQHGLQWSGQSGAPSGGTATGAEVSVVGESVEGLSVGAREVCEPIPGYTQSYSSGLHTAGRWRSAILRRSDEAGEPLCTRVVYRHRRCGERGTCDGGRRGCQEVLRVVGVSRLVRACLVQVTVVLSRIVRVPFTHKVLVFHALAAARVESACRALAAGAYFHILVVGLRAPNRTQFVPKPAGPN